MAGFYSNDVDISNATGILQHLDDDELKQIVNDSMPSRIDVLVKDLPQVNVLDSERERLIQENKRIAEDNLSLETKYQSSRQELLKSLQECQTLKCELDKKKSKLRELSRQNSLDTTLALMQAAMAEAEETSDEVANSFLKKEITIDEFLKEFIEKRKLFHSRRIKVEKMPEEIGRVNSGGYQPTRPAPPPPPFPSMLPFSQLQVNSGSDSNPNQPPYPTNNNSFAPFYSYPPNQPYNYK